MCMYMYICTHRIGIASKSYVFVSNRAHRIETALMVVRKIIRASPTENAFIKRTSLDPRSRASAIAQNVQKPKLSISRHRKSQGQHFLNLLGRNNQLWSLALRETSENTSQGTTLENILRINITATCSQ